MQSLAQTQPILVSNSKASLWAGRIVSVLAIAFLIFDGVIKMMQMPQAVEPTVKFGYAASLVLVLGLLELACLALYLLSRTAVLGAILLTGYLGGAIATQVRADSGAFSIIFPVIIGVLIWGGLFLRDSQLRALVPLRS